MGPYHETRVEKLENAGQQVTVSGIVVTKDEQSMQVDDGSATVTVIGEQDVIGEVATNSFVRVFGTMVTASEQTINAVIVQDLGKNDRYLYDQVRQRLINGQKKTDE